MCTFPWFCFRVPPRCTAIYKLDRFYWNQPPRTANCDTNRCWSQLRGHPHVSLPLWPLKTCIWCAHHSLEWLCTSWLGECFARNQITRHVVVGLLRWLSVAFGRHKGVMRCSCPSPAGWPCIMCECGVIVSFIYLWAPEGPCVVWLTVFRQPDLLYVFYLPFDSGPFRGDLSCVPFVRSNRNEYGVEGKDGEKCSEKGMFNQLYSN